MSVWLLEGLKIGILLSLLAGPLLFALLDATLSKGRNGGLSLAAGIWLSDWLFVGLVLQSATYLQALSEQGDFRFWISLCGALTLAGSGIAMMKQARHTLPDKTPAFRKRSYLLRGFLINTLNPFTVFFWLGAVGAIAVQQELSKQHLWGLCLGIMLCITFSDLLKVYFAAAIRHHLQVRYLQGLRMGAGIALICFGVWLLWQAWR